MSEPVKLSDPIRGVSDAADPEFEEYVLEKVSGDGDYYTLHFDGGLGIGLEKALGVVPAAGQTVRMYGRGFGYPVRGIAVNGLIAYYRTRAEDEAKHRADVEDSNAKKRAKFEVDREDHDRRIAALPPVFASRFARFLKHNPDFRWEFEGYELFCCEEAVRLAAHARAAGGSAFPVEWVRAFAAAPVGAQKQMAPDMKLDEHSVNTFGFTCQLARAYIEDETVVPRMHGSLASLVGCEEYGCPPDAPAIPGPVTEVKEGT